MAGEKCVQMQYLMCWDVVSLPGIPANPEIEAYDFEEVSYACLLGTNSQNTQSDLWFYLLKLRHLRWPDFQNMLSICVLRCIELYSPNH